MNEKEFNGLILAELVKIANDVFTNEIEIAPGTYTAAELAKLKDANGNEINIKYLCVDAKLNITDFRTVQINSFKCSFPVDQVFNLVWQFEKLISTKQANKTRFTKIEERENIVCSFDMWITKEHLNITKLVTKDSLRPAFNYIYLDHPYKSALVAYIDRPLVFPVPIFIHKHERTISRIVVPKLLNHQCIALLFVSMMLPELLRRYVWGTIRPKANADELFWGDFRRFHTKGNHRIRDGTKEANKPKLQPFQTNYYIYQ